MSDLISRKELIERIVNRTGSPTVLFNTTEELNAYLEGCAFKQNDIIDIVNDIPTAYNLEKVVAELVSAYGNIINIVRNGGKE